jgi:hypothetical protein
MTCSVDQSSEKGGLTGPCPGLQYACRIRRSRMTDCLALFIRQEWTGLQRELDSLRPEQNSRHAFFYQAKQLGFLRGNGCRRPMLRCFAMVDRLGGYPLQPDGFQFIRCRPEMLCAYERPLSANSGRSFGESLNNQPNADDQSMLRRLFPVWPKSTAATFLADRGCVGSAARRRGTHRKAPPCHGAHLEQTSETRPRKKSPGRCRGFEFA